MAAPERDVLRDERLKELFLYAKANSPYFAKLYKDFDEDFSLAALPPTNKDDLMAHFDDWVTDRNIRLSDLTELMSNSDNVGKRYLGMYTIFATSGTTGSPGVIVYDDAAWNILAAIHAKYYFARKRDFVWWAAHFCKTAVIFVADAFNGTSVQMHRMLDSGSTVQRRYKCIDLFEPISRIVAELNAFKPTAIIAYPTALKLLTEEARAGRLRISPGFIMSGGEHLGERERVMLKETFKCYVQNTYGCTEGGTVAHECRHGRLHLHDDWIIMEPVDKDNKPVPAGTPADKWLMTALASYAQPIIRYEIDDRVILHDEACPCGSVSPWIELEGKVGEVFTCHGKGGKVSIVQAVFYEILSRARGIKGFQLIQRTDKNFKLRIAADDKEDAFRRVHAALCSVLAQAGAEAEIVLSEKSPQIDPKSGKLKLFIIEK
jgi:putative adenylate-forming enzyme